MNEIIDLILKTYSVNNSIQVKQFLEKLRDGEEYHKRLLICLGIDTKADLLDKKKVSDIFNSINFSICTNCDVQLDEYEKKLNRSSYYLSSKSSYSDKKLSRVMRASSFSANFYNRIEDIFNDSKDWKEIKNEIDRGNLDVINMPNDSSIDDPRKIVWCTPLEDLETIIQECLVHSKNPANEIVDRLGLYLNSSQDYIYIAYHEEFKEVIFQPSNFCNCWRWKESLYLSCITNDNFGRTRPRTGDEIDRQMKEAVHQSIEDSSKFQCSIKYLGLVTDFDLNTTDFTNDAMKRFAL